MSPIGINNLSRMWTCWPDLIAQVVKKHEVTLLGTKEEGDFYWENVAVENVLDKFGKTTIQQVIHDIKNSDLHIGGDTGLTQIAISIEKPTFIIFQNYNVFFRCSHINQKNVIAFFRPESQEVIDKMEYLQMLGL